MTSPLSRPVPRSHMHTRTILCDGYRRTDGLWDIEAHLTDIKGYTFRNHDRGEIPSGEPLHGMFVRLTVDDSLEIKDVEVKMEYTPYSYCPSVEPSFERLKGVKVGPGFTRKLKQIVGGTAGCTHVLEMMRGMATVAYQTVFTVLMRERGMDFGIDRTDDAPALLDSCHSYASDSPVVARIWPDHYSGPNPSDVLDIASGPARDSSES